jgi:hypothetical protein
MLKTTILGAVLFGSSLLVSCDKLLSPISEVELRVETSKPNVKIKVEFTVDNKVHMLSTVSPWSRKFDGYEGDAFKISTEACENVGYFNITAIINVNGKLLAKNICTGMLPYVSVSDTL